MLKMLTFKAVKIFLQYIGSKCFKKSLYCPYKCFLFPILPNVLGKKDPLSWVEAQFNNLGEITEGNLQLHLIVSTCSSFYYETAKYLATYPTYSL